jgi:uncharacterized protein (TIGR03083 family)
MHTLSQDAYADHVLADVGRFASVLDTADLAAPVPSCPGWTVADLVRHLGGVHRWAGFCAAEGRPPADGEGPSTDPFPDVGSNDEVSAWFRRGGTDLADIIRALDPTAPTFHPFPYEQIAGIWPRRMAHETAMHRWDGENAAGHASPIDPTLASDGIDEYFEIALPRVVGGSDGGPPAGSLHVHCTDVDGEWLVWFDDDGFHLVREHQKGDAALRGPAEAILLHLWGRTDGGSDELSPVGDEAVLTDWLSVAGV